MIAKLKGTIDTVGPNWAIVDVNGVGYQVYCDNRTLSQLESASGPISVFTETVLRQDSLTLYGFVSAEDQDYFRLLTTVQGVGMKVALSILSVLSPPDIAHAIATQDKAMMGRADGVGPKLATRIVTELKDKVGGMMITRPLVMPSQAANHPAHVSADAVSALVNLGYRRAEASDAVTAILRDSPDSSLDTLLPRALQHLAGNHTQRTA